METPQEFVTTTSILSFGGASLAVLLISTTIQRVTAIIWIFKPFAAAIEVGFDIGIKSG